MKTCIKCGALHLDHNVKGSGCPSCRLKMSRGRASTNVRKQSIWSQMNRDDKGHLITDKGLADAKLPMSYYRKYYKD